MKGDVFTWGCHVLLIQMSSCHCLNCPSAQLNAFSHRWSTLKGDWKTWTCPESILPRRWGWTTETWGHCLVCTWWVRLCMERKWIEKAKKNNSRTFFCYPVVCQGWGWPVSVSSNTVVRVYVCVNVFLGGSEEGAVRQVSSLLTQTVNSSIGKVCPSGALYFSNNTPLVRPSLCLWLK